MLEDPARLEAMATAARGLAKPDAARRIADQVLEAANDRRDRKKVSYRRISAVSREGGPMELAGGCTSSALAVPG